MNRKQIAFSFAAGLLFALGLVISGMTQPAKVIGFLNLAGLSAGISWSAEPGKWDPSLALVMGGALIITLMAFSSVSKWHKPWAEQQFHLPKRSDIDRPLVLGSALFGVGWGLAGYCPGPGLASMFSAGADALWFVAAMLLGMVLAKWLQSARSAQS